MNLLAHAVFNDCVGIEHARSLALALCDQVSTNGDEQTFTFDDGSVLFTGPEQVKWFATAHAFAVWNRIVE